MSVYTYVENSSTGQTNSSVINLEYNQDGTVSTFDENGFGETYIPVSYTHLTLPTILLV